MYILMMAIMLVGESDGKFSEWSGWSTCPASGGLQSREREVEREVISYTQLRQTKNCTIKITTTHKPTATTKLTTTKSTKLENLALGKAASQSSTSFNEYKATNAVDGDLTTYSETNTVVAWWRVDMGKPAIISKVRVYPLYDFFGYITNTTVTIGNNVDEAMTSCGMFTGDYIAHDVTCTKPLVGRYVQVNKNSDNGYLLEMDEFEVYGQYI